jgi:hypothetical protein
MPTLLHQQFHKPFWPIEESLYTRKTLSPHKETAHAYPAVFILMTRIIPFFARKEQWRVVAGAGYVLSQQFKWNI